MVQAIADGCQCGLPGEFTRFHWLSMLIVAEATCFHLISSLTMLSQKQSALSTLETLCVLILDDLLNPLSSYFPSLCHVFFSC